MGKMVFEVYQALGYESFMHTLKIIIKLLANV